MEGLIFWVILISLGYFFGRRTETRHYQSIIAREQTMLHLPATNFKYPLDRARAVQRCHLVSGNVVVSIDYFKRLLAALRNFIGGSVQPYETLLDRARREAVLRLKESCADADEIINLRIETSSIYNGAGNKIGSVEVLAYGTAIYY